MFELTSRGADVPALVCLSHLRWNFVFQRPQHLMTRAARDRPVLFFEEPIYGDGPAWLEVSGDASGVRVGVPHLPHGIDPAAQREAMSAFLDQFLATEDVTRYVLWYYTPMALSFSSHLEPLAVVYDCMDELAAFKGAPPELLEREHQLLERADLVFTGGQSLYEAKRGRHPHVHAFPSSIDVQHFRRARTIKSDPADQRNIPHPRLGFFGVLDERFDIELLEGAAELRPCWHFVMIGPVVKIDPATLPQRDNIHYLGMRKYEELPSYLAGWDVALLPFARNEATRFISPTKTPEYLAAGRPVISTSIRDVVRPYGEEGLVRIADTPHDLVAAAVDLLREDVNARVARADAFLKGRSWDRTWAEMDSLIQAALPVEAHVTRPAAAAFHNVLNPAPGGGPLPEAGLS